MTVLTHRRRRRWAALAALVALAAVLVVSMASPAFAAPGTCVVTNRTCPAQKLPKTDSWKDFSKAPIGNWVIYSDPYDNYKRWSEWDKKEKGYVWSWKGGGQYVAPSKLKKLAQAWNSLAGQPGLVGTAASASSVVTAGGEVIGSAIGSAEEVAARARGALTAVSGWVANALFLVNKTVVHLGLLVDRLAFSLWLSHLLEGTAAALSQDLRRLVELSGVIGFGFSCSLLYAFWHTAHGRFASAFADFMRSILASTIFIIVLTNPIVTYGALLRTAQRGADAILTTVTPGRNLCAKMGIIPTGDRDVPVAPIADASCTRWHVEVEETWEVVNFGAVVTATPGRCADIVKDILSNPEDPTSTGPRDKLADKRNPECRKYAVYNSAHSNMRWAHSAIVLFNSSVMTILDGSISLTLLVAQAWGLMLLAFSPVACAAGIFPGRARTLLFWPWVSWLPASFAVILAAAGFYAGVLLIQSSLLEMIGQSTTDGWSVLGSLALMSIVTIALVHLRHKFFSTLSQAFGALTNKWATVRLSNAQGFGWPPTAPASRSYERLIAVPIHWPKPELVPFNYGTVNERIIPGSPGFIAKGAQLAAAYKMLDKLLKPMITPHAPNPTPDLPRNGPSEGHFR